MATNDDPRAPTPASGEPTDPAEPVVHEDGLVEEDAQVALIGNTPDGQVQQGAIRPGKEDPTGLDG